MGNSVFDRLVLSVQNEVDFKAFIMSEIEEFYDFVSTNSYETLLPIRFDFERFIYNNWAVINCQDIEGTNKTTFYILLLELSARYSLFDSFNKIYQSLKRNNIDIPLYLECVRYYSIGNTSFNQIKGKFNKYWETFDESIEAGDNSIKLCENFINYYCFIVETFGDYNIAAVDEFKEYCLREIEKLVFSEVEYLKNVLGIPVINSQTSLIIQESIDGHFNRSNLGYEIDLWSEDVIYIESGTEYAEMLSCASNSFSDIRQIASSFIVDLVNSDSIFTSLDRGVAILQNNDQLAMYMHSYGKMHFEKLREALYSITTSILEVESKHIVDWGCGQGIGIMAIKSFLDISNVSNITLIEPSRNALERASLHTHKLFEDAEIQTILKSFDNLPFSKINISSNTDLYLHVFSNVLDLDNFCLTTLDEGIKNTFPGTNLFVCVSPYINEMRKNRLELFMNGFDYKELYLSSEARKNEWINGWTKVIRVFSAEI